MSEESLEQKLNRLAKSANLKVPNNVPDILPWGELTSVTPFFNKNPDYPILLNDVVAVPIKVYRCETPKFQVPEDFKGEVGLHRCLISFGATKRIVDEQSLIEVLNPVIVAGVKDLINNFGDLSKYRLSLIRDGYEGSGIFRFSEHHNAIEFRIIAIKE